LIWHQETAHDHSPQVTVTLSSGTQIGPQAIPTSNTLANPAPAIDLTAAIKADAANQPYPWRDLQGISVSYSDSSSGGSDNSDNDQVDGVELKVTYEAPALEGTRCDKQTGGICPILTNDKSSTIILPGTAYAPSASFDVTTFNKGAEAEGLIFHRGVIAQDVTLNINGSSHKQTEAPFQLPGATTFRKVLFTAKNTADGHVYLRALVQFVDSIDDDTGAAVLQPGASVKILEWTVLR
jgi:hypothetical protein